MPIKIVSMVKIDGRWINQEEIPTEEFQEILTKVMIRAGNAIGAKVQKNSLMTEKPIEFSDFFYPENAK